MKKNIFKTLAVTVLSAVSLTAWAVDPVSYLDGTGTEQTCTEYTVVESSSSAVTWNAGWYVVSGDVTIANRITFNGNVNLILCDGAKLTITGDENGIGIDGYDGDDIYDLTVYGQSEGSGSMSVTGGPAIINVNYLTINGGSVEAIGDDYGIGGENVTINGGELTVTGRFVGFDTGNGTVTINGGKLTVTSGGNAFKSEWGGYGDFGTVKINGGELTATGNNGVVHDFSVINAIAGTGWTDAAGTEGETAIAVSTEGQDLSAYKKVQFSAAANSSYAAYVNTTTVMHFDDKDWYLIEDNSTSETEGTVTLLTKECVGASAYNSLPTFFEYSNNPTVKTAVDNWYSTEITADAKTAVSGGGMFLLTKPEAVLITNAEVRKDANAANGGWWLCSQGGIDEFAAFVNGGSGDVNVYGSYVSLTLGVRPALKLDLSKVTFDTETKTFTVVGSEQAEGAPALGAAVTFSGEQWNVIGYNGTGVATATGTVTLLRASSYDANSTFDDNRSNVYSSSTLRGVIDGHLSDFTTEEQSAIITRTLAGGGYAGDNNSDYVSGASVDAKLWPLSAKEATELIANSYSISLSGYWWLRSPGSYETEVECIGDGSIFDYMAVDIPLGVRPALQLDLTKIAFDTETNTFSATAATSVATPTLSPADAAKSNIWYDLNGRHYQGKPTMPGVYINNHQKYVVK